MQDTPELGAGDSQWCRKDPASHPVQLLQSHSGCQTMVLPAFHLLECNKTGERCNMPPAGS